MPTRTRITTALLAATTPLVAAATAPRPSAAQQTQSRVLVSTHARAARGPPMRRSWSRFSPRRASADVGCWLPESVLPLSRGFETDLLNVADRLLASPEGRSLEEWVAAHNLFLDRWNPRWSTHRPF